jgi:hypothetical protein
LSFLVVHVAWVSKVSNCLHAGFRLDFFDVHSLKEFPETFSVLVLNVFNAHLHIGDVS